MELKIKVKEWQLGCQSARYFRMKEILGDIIDVSPNNKPMAYKVSSNEESGWDRHERHMQPIREQQKKIVAWNK